ncbi:MAG: hypothetical protein IPK91_15785 [Saprospiraceae bacterium]|nr:hypothetical protein [Saprospiraceae bacterium]MBK8298704.1 hypothetical protein [Saprospiraceae bacterium]
MSSFVKLVDENHYIPFRVCYVWMRDIQNFVDLLLVHIYASYYRYKCYFTICDVFENLIVRIAEHKSTLCKILKNNYILNAVNLFSISRTFVQVTCDFFICVSN